MVQVTSAVAKTAALAMLAMTAISTPLHAQNATTVATAAWRVSRETPRAASLRSPAVAMSVVRG